MRNKTKNDTLLEHTCLTIITSIIYYTYHGSNISFTYLVFATGFGKFMMSSS